MNIQHGCRCAPGAAPVLPAPPKAEPPAEPPAAAAPARPAKAASAAVISQSYFVGYFTHAYVSAARQSAAPGGEAAGKGQATVAQSAEADRPARFRRPGPASRDPVTQPPATAADQASTTPERPAVRAVGAEGLRQFRMQHLAASTRTSLELELTTREGDRVVLDFSQMDALVRTRFRGVDGDGTRFSAAASALSTEQVVNLEITGDISEEEKAAIGALLDRILEVANAFFEGTPADALARVQDMGFDGGTLAEVSLEMRMTHSVELTRAFTRGDDALRSLAQRDADVRRSLHALGESQRGLVEEAKNVLDDRGAARVVRSLLPPMLDAPLRRLAEALEGVTAEAPRTTPEPNATRTPRSDSVSV